MPKTILLLLLLVWTNSYTQPFSRKDSLQGGLRFERTCFDVLRYDLNIKVNPNEKSIEGFNKITFNVVSNTSKIQLDLFENMTIDSIIYKGKKLHFDREFNAVFISFPKILPKNSQENILFYYHGKPQIAKNAPWDGGFVFSKDNKNNPWIGVACQGTGASLWYPCKDSQTDEPNDGATIKVAVPNGLMNVSNGKYIGNEDLKNGYTRWDWEVKNPINNYDITLNIAHYTRIHDNYKGLNLDYYVLPENEAKAKSHFEIVKPMLDCFEKKFGKYPFAEDGYKLVETPYLGMEHQSAIAYGNRFLNGYLGEDRSTTGIGMNFDFVIIHESGHEWFGNSITSADIADMWIHESFTTYSEAVFVECQYGYKQGQVYINGLKNTVYNDSPIIGQYQVNQEGSTDMYSKGALMLNTIRHIINNDKKWWKILLKYSETFKHQIIDTETVIAFFNDESNMNLTTVFNQYLHYATIPVIQLRIMNGKLEYRWEAQEEGFNMPIDIVVNHKKIRIFPLNTWVKSNIKTNTLDEISILTNDFYINVN